MSRLTTGETLVLAAALAAGAVIGCVALAVAPVLLSGLEPFTLLAVMVALMVGAAAGLSAAAAAFIPVHPYWRVLIATLVAAPVACWVEVSLVNTVSWYPGAIVAIGCAVGGFVALLASRRHRERNPAPNSQAAQPR